MLYLLPYNKISKMFARVTRKDEKVNLDYDTLVDLVRHVCAAIPVDETWYRETYKTVGAALDGGAFFGSAQWHYSVVGYFEGREPFGRAHSMPISFASLLAGIHVKPIHGKLVVLVSEEEIQQMLKKLLRSIPVDRIWYVSKYSGLEGCTGLSHFSETGYFLGCWPYQMRFDEDWYLNKYPELKSSATENKWSAEQHFWDHGYCEGRLPYANILHM